MVLEAEVDQRSALKHLDQRDESSAKQIGSRADRDARRLCSSWAACHYKLQRLHCADARCSIVRFMSWLS